jgi:hypothetical protein
VVYVLAVESGEKPVRQGLPEGYLTTAPQTANIHINYSGTWSAEATAAFEYAMAIWETQVTSSVTIEIDAGWTSYSNPNVLGSSGPEAIYRDFSNAPQSGTWYPVALANKLYSSDLDTGTSDIGVNFNQNFPNWYFGTDGNTPTDKWDFVSVAVHEIGHGLGMVGSMSMSGSSGYWGSGGYPYIYDRFAVNGSGQSLLNTGLFPNYSAALGAQLISGNLFFNGANAVAASGDGAVKLYAPSSWQSGSSYSHLDNDKYPISSGDALMTPSIGNGEVIWYPGPITRGIFADIGWTLSSSGSTPTKTNTPTKTATLRAIRTPNTWRFLPNLDRKYPGSYVASTPTVVVTTPASGNAISGQVKYGGTAASGVALMLRYCISGSGCTTAGTTTTGGDGRYAFTNVTPISGGSVYYYVRYANETDASRLSAYGTQAVETVTSTSKIDLGSFDIADIALSSPAAGATVPGDSTFTWTRRSATTSDSYEYDLYSSELDLLWWSAKLGYTDHYGLGELPDGIYTGIPYYWAIWTYDSLGGYGISYYARSVTFSSYDASAAVVEVTLTPEQQLQLLEKVEEMYLRKKPDSR